MSAAFMSMGITTRFNYQCQTKFPAATHEAANRRIAQSLRSDTRFMAELKRLGIYDEDAESVLDDTEVLEA